MSQIRKLQIKIEILRALNACEGIAMSEHTLCTQVRILVSPTPLMSELHEGLRHLETTKRIVGVPGALESGTKWLLTDNGKAELASIESNG
ncbi:MAG TPA: hypothetical protein VF773_12020 [Verrucomicrobiae bacterium]